MLERALVDEDGGITQECLDLIAAIVHRTDGLITIRYSELEAVKGSDIQIQDDHLYRRYIVRRIAKD